MTMRLIALTALIALTSLPTFADDLDDQIRKEEWFRAANKAETELRECWAAAEMNATASPETACRSVKAIVSQIFDSCMIREDILVTLMGGDDTTKEAVKYVRDKHASEVIKRTLDMQDQQC
jgi:hypothetical protein